jgi:hypothetical protein
MLKVILGILGALALSIASSECHEAAGWLSSRIVRLAVRRLPKRLRDVREEEWLAELDAFEGLRILKLAWSLGVLFAAFRLRFRYRGEHKAQRSRRIFPDLRPGPGVIVVMRQHPAILLESLVASLSSLLTAIALTIHTGPVPFLVFMWLFWLALAIVFWRDFRTWCARVCVLTSEQLSLPAWSRSPNGCRVSPDEVSRITLKRDLLGRFLDYGTLIIEESGGRVHTTRFVPYPAYMLQELGQWLPASPMA